MFSNMFLIGRQWFVQVQRRRSMFQYVASILQEDRAGVHPGAVRWPPRYRDLLALRSKHAVPCREDDP